MKPSRSLQAVLACIAMLSVIVSALAASNPWPLGYVNMQTKHTADKDTPKYSRTTVKFPCGGVACEAWLYLPKTNGTRPIVVMANGLGGQKDQGLENFAEPLVLGGAAVFLFDYRTFGGSEGVPRNWISGFRQLDDWDSALNFVQGPGFAAAAAAARINVNKLAIWGSSFGGGHVIVVAAKMGARVTSVISQVPHLSSDVTAFSSLIGLSPVQMFQMLPPSIEDFKANLAGEAPLKPGQAVLTVEAPGNITRVYAVDPSGASTLRGVYLETFGRKGSLAMMQLDDDDLKQYWQSYGLDDYQGGWRNIGRAQFSQEGIWSFYNPFAWLPFVKAKILMIAGTEDKICPIWLARKSAMLVRNMPGSEYVELKTGHFGVYLPPLLNTNMAIQVAFMKKTLMT
ncbi:MAG: Alpha/Beta hydrolase protein [Monoraphidium minutum]|nr:MAG: Alpha/Beta hydrolase protein [Monoraphidium minutum]